MMKTIINSVMFSFLVVGLLAGTSSYAADKYIPQSSSTFQIEEFIKENPYKKVYKAGSGAFACMSQGNIEKIADCNRSNSDSCDPHKYIDGDRCYYISENTKVVVVDKDSKNSDYLWVRVDGLDWPIWTVRPVLKDFI